MDRSAPFCRYKGVAIYEEAPRQGNFMAPKSIRPEPIRTEDYVHNGRTFHITARQAGTQYVASWRCNACGHSGTAPHDPDLMSAIARAQVSLVGHICDRSP